VIIEAIGGDDQVKANYLPTALTDAARLWLNNLPKGTIYNWDQLCAIFIGNFQSTDERPSTVETLKTIKHKPDESLWEYVKHFCNTRNAIPYIQDIEIINAFYDGVGDIKTIEEIAMKNPRMVVDLLAVTNVCIEALEARVWPLESRNKGPSKKKKQEYQEVNTADCEDRGNYENRQQQPADQKEKRLL
jgi:hypothetical protein